MYELAKKSREDMKAKARRLAGEKEQKVDSSDWSPAAPLNADIKTGARPIMRPSAKGVGESIAASDTKAAIGNPKRGAYKDGGGVYDKKALGAIDPRPTRAAAQHYKKGGRIKREDGGKLPDPYEAMRSEERMGRMKVEEKRKLPPPKEAAESAARTGDMLEGRKHGGEKWISKAIKKPGALRESLGVKEGEKIPAKKLAAAAEKGGKLGQRARLAQTLKKIGKKKGGAITGLTVVIADKRDRGPQAPALPGGPMMRGVPMPPPPPISAPPAAMPPMPPVAPGPMPMGRKSGGRITKIAKSYKDMEAGAATGEGRLQKTDIAKLHKDAPARKDGGRISKVAKSYMDMTAGAGDGEGRLQKTDIAKAKKVRAA